MKGVVFTEFMEYVEEQFGTDVAAQIVSAANLPSGGTYSAIGDYDHAELVRLVDALAATHKVSGTVLLRQFGTHLFHRFAAMYPVFFADAQSAFDLLAHIDTYIHAELLKLYPNAEFPSFECTQPAPGRLEMVYRSRRGFADLAEGLILGCVQYFGDPVAVERSSIGQAVRFSLVQQPA